MGKSERPVLVRRHRMLLGRQFLGYFESGLVGRTRDTPEVYRDQVDARLVSRFGVPLPGALAWLVLGAWRRSVSPEQLAEFLGQAFELDPL